MSNSDLAGILKAKKREHAAKDWDAEKTAWLESIAALHASIEVWLEPVVAQGLLRIERSPVSLSERLLGTYQTEELILKTDSSEVRVTPVSHHVVGALGRVDIRGTDDSVRLVNLGAERGWCVSLAPDEPYLFPFTEEELSRLLERLL